MCKWHRALVSSACKACTVFVFSQQYFLQQEDTCVLLEDFYEKNITDSINCPGKLTDLLFIRGGPWPGTLDGRNVTNYFDDFSMIVFPCVPVMRAYPVVMSWGSLHRACRCEASVWDLKTAHRHTHTHVPMTVVWPLTACLWRAEVRGASCLLVHSQLKPMQNPKLVKLFRGGHYKTALRLFLGCKACLHQIQCD